MSQVAWLSVNPVWALMMIALDTVALYALTHGGRMSGRIWPNLRSGLRPTAARRPLSAHQAALLKILRRVPAEQMDSTPELIFCTVVLLFHAGDYEAIPARIARARELLRNEPDDAARRPVEAMLFTPEMLANRAVALDEGADLAKLPGEVIGLAVRLDPPAGSKLRAAGAAEHPR